MPAFLRALLIISATLGPISCGSMVGSAEGPRCQPSATARVPPLASKTLPETSDDCSLASHTTIGATHFGSPERLRSSLTGPPRSSVRRVRAPGAMQLTVTPYL